MDFQEAVKTCLNKYATFSGRAWRPEYWWFALFSYFGGVILGIVDRILFGPDVGVLGAIWGLALIVPAVAVGVRRMHDLDRSGWWLLIGLIPLLGALILIYWFVQAGTRGSNRYGPEPRVRRRSA